MNKFGNPVARSERIAPGAWAAAIAGLGLAMLAGGAAVAAEVATGQAEAAPAEVVQELAAGRLVTATPTPEAAVNPARVVAHTAQLPRPSGKPTVSVALPKPPPPVPTAASSPAPAAAGAGKPPPVAKATGPSTGSATGAATRPAAGPARRARLPLAPSAAEIRREIAARNGGPLSGSSPGAAGPPEAAKDKPSAAARLQERATTTPTQNPRWPTHVDYSAGPTGPAGGNTAADRKGSLIEATGPQQGVIRNRW